jgi:hypothetical protein
LASRQRLDGGGGPAGHNGGEKVEDVEGQEWLKIRGVGATTTTVEYGSAREVREIDLGAFRLILVNMGISVEIVASCPSLCQRQFFGRLRLSTDHTSLERSRTSDLDVWTV